MREHQPDNDHGGRHVPVDAEDSQANLYDKDVDGTPTGSPEDTAISLRRDDAMRQFEDVYNQLNDRDRKELKNAIAWKNPHILGARLHEALRHLDDEDLKVLFSRMDESDRRKEEQKAITAQQKKDKSALAKAWDWLKRH